MEEKKLKNTVFDEERGRWGSALPKSLTLSFKQ